MNKHYSANSLQTVRSRFGKTDVVLALSLFQTLYILIVCKIIIYKRRSDYSLAPTAMGLATAQIQRLAILV